MLIEERRTNSFLSLDTLERVGLTVAVCFFLYLIWNSSTELKKELNANSDQFAVVHNLQVEYKNEIQEWKNLLLRSNGQDSLTQNWRTFERQYQKVSATAKEGMLQNDVRAVNAKLQSFIEQHEANFLLYKKSSEILAQQKFNPHQADANVKGIDRPLLDILEAGDAEMEAEKTRITERIVAKSINRIELSLIALFLVTLIAVWRPRH